jgi:hypothetical protein
MQHLAELVEFAKSCEQTKPVTNDNDTRVSGGLNFDSF